MPVFSIFCSVSMACSYHYNPSFYTFHPKATLPTRFFHPMSLAHGITHTHSLEVKANTGRQKMNNITSITRVDGVESQLDHREDICSGSLGVCDVVVGVLGGGQLGRMLCQAASPLGIKVAILDPAEDCPASKLAYRHVVGSFRDAHAVKEFAKGCGVLTVEIEHVDVETLDVLASEGVDIEPSPRSIRIIQDKYLQKVHFHQCGVPLPDFMKIDNEDDAKRAGQDFGYPMMLKSRLLAYDGRGNAVVRSQDDLMPAVSLLGGFGRGLYAEKWAPFVKELAVMVARGRDGSLCSFPVVETWHKDNICHMVQAPALISVRSAKSAMETAEKAVGSLTGAGIFGVELFLLDDGQVLLNEVAPRPHNSGHYSIEACFVSQFEQHLRAVLGLPLGNSSMKVPAAMMYNLLGEEEGAMGFEIAQNVLHQALLLPGASVHWYEKPEIRKHRKIGHITITGASMEAVKEQMSSLVPHESEEKNASQHIQESCEKFQLAKVGIIMGSDSDLPVMKDAAVVLDMFDIPYEIKIVSAHRTPLFMVEYAQQASSRGIQVIIAGAGGAAHLPGMVASLTTLPVIGVPVKGSSLDGYDSLLSIVQMPKGVPVATIGIQNATNAGLLAARILGSSNTELQSRVSAYQEELKASVSSKNVRLSVLGWKDY